MKAKKKRPALEPMPTDYERGRADERHDICAGITATLERFQPDNALDESALFMVMTMRNLRHQIESNMIQTMRNPPKQRSTSAKRDESKPCSYCNARPGHIGVGCPICNP